MGVATIPPEPDILVQLRRTYFSVRGRLDADLDATGLTTPQYLVLAALERSEQLSASDLAREFGLTAQTVNVLVKGLEQSGLVRRRAHPNHGRILQTKLTAAGLQALRHGRALALVVQEQLLASLSPADRSVLVRSLSAIERASR